MNSSYKANFITSETAHFYDKTLQCKAYLDQCNSVDYIIGEKVGIAFDIEDKGMYVDAPIVTWNDIKSVLNSQNNVTARSSWLKKRLVSSLAPT